MRSLTASANRSFIVTASGTALVSLLTIQPVHRTLPQGFLLSAGNCKDGHSNPLLLR
jgi:hypothetical protein